ncbi:MAG: heat-inducible transcription repressor HrcA [Myxococcales bacterium]|nr:heat-inducible transcription repressor HrcA [Myxococcales bacterium]HRC57939.1 heat-inducible transcriptional repressor HrcA [Kofleriaceae bacterium]
MSGADLSRRAQRILQAVVSEYLQSGDAVGSRTVTRRHDLGLSPATVRNVMSDLEELGLLEQPHSSAGRVPTHTGLRFFIDALLKVKTLSPRDQEDIRGQMLGSLTPGPRPRPSPEDVMLRASRVLSNLTHHAAVVVAPDPDAQRLSQIEFVPLRDGKLLAILVTSDGRIENRIVALDGSLDPRRLERIHTYLNQLLSGMTLDEVRERVIREISDEKNRYDSEVSQALTLGHTVFVRAPERPAEVVVTGQANLLEPGVTADPDRETRMRELLRTLEDKETLLRLLDRTRSGAGMQVFLGAETALSALSGSSVVAMPYGPEDTPIGALAVIGPMRMNYGKVMSVVDFTAEIMTELLTDAGG